MQPGTPDTQFQASQEEPCQPGAVGSVYAVVTSCLSFSSNRGELNPGASLTLFPLIERLDIRHIGGLGIVHLVRCPILERVIGMSIHRVPNNSNRIIRLRKTLPGKQ